MERRRNVLRIKNIIGLFGYLVRTHFLRDYILQWNFLNKKPVPNNSKKIFS